MRAGLVALTLSAGTLFCLAAGGVPNATAQAFYVPSDANQYILDQTNAFRQENGLPRLTMDGASNRAADRYAEHLAKYKTSGHTADGFIHIDRHIAEGGQWPLCLIEENVHASWNEAMMASWQQAAAGAINAWKNSSEDRANMLSDANKTGIGVHGWQHGNEWHYRFVQVFIQTNC